MTKSEFYTTQFYAWESRGRGWYLSDVPVQLEPPFMPFYRHGYPGTDTYVDDGKKHTLISKFIERFSDKKTPAIKQNQLDYEQVEVIESAEATALKAIQVKFPKERKFSHDKMKALLVMIAYTPVPFSFEVIGTATEIIVQFVCDEEQITILETYIHAFFPQCDTVLSDTFIDAILNDSEELGTAVIDFGIQQEFVRPINTGKGMGIDTLTVFYSVLEQLSENEQAGMQVLFQPSVNTWTESIISSVTMYDNSSFFMDAPESPQLAREKVQSPLFGVTIRTFAQAPDLDNAFAILERISRGILHAGKGQHNELTTLPSPAYDFHTRVDDILARQSHRLGMLLNADELVSFIHFPGEGIVSKKLYAATRKTKTAPAIATGKPYIIGTNTHLTQTIPVSFGIEDRLKHTHIIGSTGTGKSTLIANLLLQDIHKENAVVLFDPHGDLVEDIIARVPKDRVRDVVLVDPSDTEYPIGLNILEAHSDAEKEVLSSDLVASFRRYATSWGDQMSTVLGNAIAAILEHPDGGTLHELRRFLIEKDFRMQYLRKVTDPAIQYYWLKEYPLLKSNSIGPILTRLDTFLRPKSIRNMVVQQKGIDFATLLDEGKIILLKLSQGLIGVENSFLLGSLLLSKLHQAILSRQQQEHRNPVFIYLDEFQNFITPSVKEMITGIRKYAAGLTLSHQDLQQLQRQDGDLLNSILGSIHTRVVFRVGEPDAKKLQESFNSFDAGDLQNLGRGEAVLRIEQPQYDCSVDTVPLSAIDAEKAATNKTEVIAQARSKYATPKAVVEEALLKTMNLFGTEAPAETISKPKSESIQPKERKPNQSAEPIQTEQPNSAQKKQPKQEIVQPLPIHKPEEVSTNHKDQSTHRYLQMLIKKMAEARGYTATIEQQLPDGSGSVDVLLAKETKTIAIEICVTTDADWELHNIEKCIAAGYSEVVSVSGDIKQVEKIKKKCKEGIKDFATHTIHFFTPDALINHLDKAITTDAPQEQIIKGYRVNVTYENITPEEMERKRQSVAKVVMESLKKRRK